VLEVKNGGRDVIVSRKALLVAQQSRETERVLAELQVGGDYPAKVVSIQKYGAFVDLGGGVEGLVHISELAHGRIDRVEDMLRVGEDVTVRLLALQPGEKGGSPKLRLSLRALADAPEAKPEPERGEVLAGTVSKVTQFGVFVDTAKGTGLVPTRELGTPRNSDSRRMFPLGKEVSVVMVSKDSGRGLTFSMSRVADVEERQNFREFSRTQQTQRDDAASVGSFGALLRQELKLPDAPRAQAPAPEGTTPKAAAEASSTASAAPIPPAAHKAATGAAASAPRDAGARGPAPRGPAPSGPAPRGPAPGDRTRIDRTPSPAPTPPKPEGNGSAANLGVVRGRRRPGDRG
jgi:predicted RNA-binding protein with RPS1 domain